MFLIVAFFIVLSGNIKNINLSKRALVIGAGIDKKDGVYEITIQTFMAKLVSDSSPDMSKAVTVSAEAESIDKAVEALNVRTGKTLSFALCYVVIVGREMAESGIIDALDFLLNKSDTAANAMILFSAETAKDVMKIDTPISSSSMMLLHDMLADKQTKSYGTKTLKDFNADYFSRSKSSFMPILEKIKGGRDVEDNGSGSQEDTEVKEYYEITRTAVFREDRLALELNREETLALNFLNRNKTKGVFTAATDGDDKITYEIDRKTCKNSYDLDGRRYTADIKVVLNVAEILRDRGGAAVQNETERERAAEAERECVAELLKEKLRAVLARCDAADTDILELDDRFFQRYGKKWTAIFDGTADAIGMIEKVVKVKVEIV
jgi:Ger(x)C family germination protein